MDTYQITFETWDKLAELYYKKFSAIRLYDDVYHKFCSLIKIENPSVLEIGCGPGNVTRYLMDYRPDFRITGLDVSVNMIEYARKVVPEAEFEVMDIRYLHEIKLKYDAVFNGFCLPYQSKDDLYKFLADCATLINEKGVLYLSGIEGEYSKSGMETGSKPEYRMQVFYYTEEDLRQAITEAGFRTISVDRIMYPSREETAQVHLVVMAEK